MEGEPNEVDEGEVSTTQNISEVLARGALLYPNYEEWGRIVAVTRDLAEAVVGDMPQPEDDDPYVLLQIMVN
ncbi:hypothetical protein QJS10_CPB15g00572 [Acorus calamus]|uniref:Uncharacterized protein n=1 Tax=Acorus calamus TaxID=4465 RepID=A0AAV9D7B4_ACOCL|nr:hypothetical protein QJS10_CPB15g00572 [Acorus calamus]